MDITLWNIDFTERAILPAGSPDGGYTYMNAAMEFNGSGSFELVFHSEKIKGFAQNHPEGYFVSWGDFHGYATDYQFGEQDRIFGSHLNAILHKVVIPVYQATGEVRSVLGSIFEKYAPWLTMAETTIADTAEYQSDTYMNGDAFVQNYLETAGLGYKIYIKNRRLFFELVKPQDSNLVLSENNLNVYEMQEDFSNKQAAYGGWYKETQSDSGTKLDAEIWRYITTAEKDNIHKQDIVLSANSPSKAMEELKKRTNSLETICKTRNVEYIKDYNLGDVVSLQNGSTTLKKQISRVDLWYEGCSYHQEPTLTQWKKEEE